MMKNELNTRHFKTLLVPLMMFYVDEVILYHVFKEVGETTTVEIMMILMKTHT